jgi:hypothetical protein
MGIVESVVVVERQPQKRSSWLRMAVTWTPDFARLLEVGLLTLDPEPAPPAPRSARQERARERARRYRERQKEKAARGQQPAARP